MKTDPSTVIRTALLAAGRWFVGIVLLGAAGVRAADPTFVDVTATVTPGLPQVGFSSVSWADFNNDGRLDFLLRGLYWSNSPVIDHTWTTYAVHPPPLWLNTGNGFTNVTDAAAPEPPQLSNGPKAWADFDNDGLLDYLSTGGFHSQIWRNTGSGFTNVTDAVAPGLTGVDSGAVAWGDYDNDGRVDFLLTGGIPRRSDLDDDYPYLTPIAQLWRNTGSGFENVTATVTPGLAGVFWGVVAWADYDNDGRLDFVLSGATHSGAFSQIWRNTGSNFVNVTATRAPGLPGVEEGSVAWADYDNDGRPDLLLVGSWSRVAQIWRNTGNGFTNVTASVAPGLPPVAHASAAWGDYDDDGRLDILIAGANSYYCDGCDPPSTVSRLYRNTTAQATPPATVITKVPASASQTGIALNGSIHPHRQAGTAWFIWGDSTDYGHVTPAQGMGSGNSFTNFSQAISGLSAGVTYYYRAVGSNNQGQIALGVEQRFRLAGPGVTTSPNGEFRPNTATIKGLVTPNNLPTYGWFEWGLTPALGQITPVQFLGNGLDATLSRDLYGLAIGTIFYFRAVVSNSLGVAYGAAESLVMIDAPLLCPASSLSPPTKSLGNAGGRGYTVHALLPCSPWIVINTNSWITITSATNGTALESSLTFDVAPNTDLQARSGYVTIGGHNFLVAQAGANPDCVRHLSPWRVDRGFGAAIATINVTGRTNCPWNVVTTNSWITILSATNGVGSGQVVYAIETNPDKESRSGDIMIGNWRFSIYQFGRFYVSLPEDQIVALGGTATFSVTVTNITPFSYRWQFNGVDLVDGGGISGATTPNLVLTGVQYSQGGHYRSVVNGEYFSSSATLTVAPTSNALALAEAADTDDIQDLFEMFFWKTWSDSRGIWFGQTNTTHDGIDAIECSGLAPGTFASLETKSGGPGLLNFWWKSAFAAPSDNLLFSIGNYQSAALTNTTDWEQRSFTVPPGNVNLRWTFSNSSVGEQSQAWLDQVEFTPCGFRLWPYNTYAGSMASTGTVTLSAAADCPWNVINTNYWITILSSVTNSGSDTVTYVIAANTTAANRNGVIVIAGLNFPVFQYGDSSPNANIPLAKALDTEGSLEWSTIGAPEWFGQTVMSRDGADAAQSGPVGDDGAVTAATTVNQPGTVLFWWKVSSETNKDYLKFFINGVQQTRISGEVDWQLVTYELTSITNTLKWTYSKNDNEAVGQDRGWLDQVQFIPAAGTGHCVRAISPGSATTSANSETGSVFVLAAGGCAWDVVNTNSWVTHVANPGVGNGFVRYTVSANDSRDSRTGVLSIGGRPFTLTQPGGIPPCLYSLSATGLSHGLPAGSATVTVTTQSGCAWTVENTNTWLTITSSLTNVGSGSVTYFVSENTSSLVRTARVRIAGQILTVTQSGPPISLEQALDTIGTPLVWSPDGYRWFGQSTVTHDGVDAAQSSAPAVGWASVLETRVIGPGTLTFWWKVSSGLDGDYGFQFSLDGGQDALIKGEVDWQQRTVAIPGGNSSHSLKWIYRAGADGPWSNCGWIDQVQFTPAAGCPIRFFSGSASYPSNVSTGSVLVASPTGCPWTVVNTNSWISIVSVPGSDGTGNGAVIFAVAANPSAPARSGNLQIADQLFLVNQAGTNGPGGCTFSISPTSRTHGFAPTTNAVAVAAGADCAWSVLNTNSWVNIVSGTSGTGSGLVSYSLAANNSPNARSGSVQIAGLNFILTQNGAPGGCTFSILPGSRTHGYGAASNTVTVSAGTGCAWTVSNTNSWVNIVSGTSGTGSGLVVYTLTANNSPNARTGIVQIAGLNLTLTQLGAFVTCTYAISPVNAAHGPQEETNFISVTATAGCAWTTVNTNAWVAVISGASGTGPGTVLYKVVANPSANARSGNLDIAGQTFAITQAGTPGGGACNYTLSATNRTHDFGSATGLVSVTTMAGCAWTAVESNSWVNIISGHNGFSNGIVRYLITANSNSTPRIGNLYIAGQTFTLTQLGKMTAIRLDGLLAGGVAMLSVEGNEGKTNVVECSEDLLLWYPISTNSVPGSITDSTATNAPRRFYRSYELP